MPLDMFYQDGVLFFLPLCVGYGGHKKTKLISTKLGRWSSVSLVIMSCSLGQPRMLVG